MVPQISVIVPVFNEKDTIPPLASRLLSVLGEIKREFEVIFVDDGSTDGSFQVLGGLVAADPHLSAVRFAGNFGQTAAISAGIDHARGDTVVLIDGDLQNDPADIPLLIEKLETGYDVVSGWRRKRRDPLFSKKMPSCAANALISFLTGVKLHDFGCTLKAYKKQAIKEIRLYGEMHRFLPVFAARLGYSIAELEVRHNPRVSGRSKYGLSRIFKVILDLPVLIFLYNYSIRPNYVFGGWGLLMMALSFGFFVWTRVYRIERGILFSVALFALGIQLFLLGLLFEMTLRIYYEASVKKPYMIRSVIGRGRDGQ